MSLRRAAIASCAVLLLAGCGGDGDETQRTTLVYEAQGAPAPDALRSAARVLRARIDALAAEVVGVRVVGADRVEVTLERDEARRVADEPTITARGRIAIYDWEANVVGPGGRPAPQDITVTAGPRAGTVSGACAPRAEAAARARRVRGRTVLLRAEPPPGAAQPADCWYVLRDRPALTSADIEAAELLADPQTKQPVVGFDFTARGRERFEAVTRALARRGQDRAVTTPVDRAQQHFAIARDEQILSVPFIDYTANPDGIDASNGSQISGGFTEGSARLLAAQMRAGELQVRLRLVSS